MNVSPLKVEHEEITPEHFGRRVFVLVTKDGKTEWTDFYRAKVWGIDKNGDIALDIEDGAALLLVKREQIKLRE